MRIYVEKAGCLECHKGPMFTDNAFHNLGVPQQPWANGSDEGRFAGITQAKAYPFSSASEYSDDPTGNQAQLLAAFPVRAKDLGAFRTPTLRDTALHPPYMHGGQIADLRGVLEFYNEPDEDSPVIGTRSSHIKPLHLTDRELDLLLEFLETLNGEPLPAEYLTAPSEPAPSP